MYPTSMVSSVPNLIHACEKNPQILVKDTMRVAHYTDRPNRMCQAFFTH
jgi:hypothetical protein